MSDQLAGLNYLFNLPTSVRDTIAAVNMSLGDDFFTTACDDDPRKAAIDNLRSVGIATVIASENDGLNTGVRAPACISTAVAWGRPPTPTRLRASRTRPRSSISSRPA